VVRAAKFATDLRERDDQFRLPACFVVLQPVGG
jgi:hypothetical protein